jgi:hypothetical protein
MSAMITDTPSVKWGLKEVLVLIAIPFTGLQSTCPGMGYTPHCE